MNEGSTSCKGRSIPMPLLDRLVLEQLEERIFAPERLELLLRGLIDQARDKTADEALKAEGLRKKLQATETRIERLYAALADGTVTDTTLFRRSLSQVEIEREEIVRSVAALEKRQDVPRHLLTKENMGRFAAVARERLRAEDATLRRGYVRQFVDRIEVDDHEIRIIGLTTNLTGGVLGSGRVTAPGVPSFDMGWWARQDSNLRQHRYERRVLTS
jgi:site-specific DNA recombinase